MMASFLLLMLVLLTKSSSAYSKGLSDELRFIHKEMGSLRNENRKQNMEIASLKETVQLQNETISQHETTIKQLITGNTRIIKSDHPVPSAAKTRRKRPAQLTPTSDQNRKLFIGLPTNCSDLNRLGHTLNGFYMIKKPTNDDKFKHNTIVLDAVYCSFEQEGTFDPSFVEKPVIPSPFTSHLLPIHTFNSPILPSDDDVYFRFMAIRNKKDHFGVLTFDPSGFNKGNGFDGKTGYFKAPKYGIYHFMYEMTSFGRRGNNGTSVDFYMNDALVVNPFSSSISKEVENRIRHEVTLKLNIGDFICLKAKNKNNGNSFSSEPDIFSEFVMGFLLKETFIM